MRNLAENPPQKGKKKKKSHLVGAQSIVVARREGHFQLPLLVKQKGIFTCSAKRIPCDVSFLLLDLFSPQDRREWVFPWAM